ncbi:MAG: CehA/McbA family metallohydrolase, partial [Candidatus Acidiferrum sp.]
LTVLDEQGDSVPARISITDSKGKFYAPPYAWIAADDGYDRRERRFEAHYFDLPESHPEDDWLPPAETRRRSRASRRSSELEVSVPAGPIKIEVMKGFAYRPQTETVILGPGKNESVSIRLERLDWKSPRNAQWVSGDLHVHMNYGGVYRNGPRNLVEQAEAEDLGIVNDLIVNKEQRVPDIMYRGRQTDRNSDSDMLLIHGQEFHTSYWGHRGLLNIKEHILLPGYAGYPNTAAASLYPMNADVYDMAHELGALVGAVHPFDAIPDPFAKPAQTITDELPIDVALGKLDYLEVVGFSDHRSTAAVWYRLLNLGFRIPAGGGTDAMANFASLRGPVGMNRVFARVPGGILDANAWLGALKRGQTFATNGPLLEFSLGTQQIGDELTFAQPQTAVAFTAKLRSIVPVDHLEVVCNGKVAQTLKLDKARTSGDVEGTLPVSESGWCVLRASSDQAEYPVLDNYVYATTSPIYFTVGGNAPRAPEDAKYFAAWIDRVREATAAYPDSNSAAEKAYVLGRLAEAKRVYERLEQQVIVADAGE